MLLLSAISFSYSIIARRGSAVTQVDYAAQPATERKEWLAQHLGLVRRARNWVGVGDRCLLPSILALPGENPRVGRSGCGQMCRVQRPCTGVEVVIALVSNGPSSRLTESVGGLWIRGVVRARQTQRSFARRRAPSLGGVRDAGAPCPEIPLLAHRILPHVENPVLRQKAEQEQQPNPTRMAEAFRNSPGQERGHDDHLPLGLPVCPEPETT